MKKAIVAALLLAATGIGYCAQPNSLGSVKVKNIVIGPLTLAEINTTTPDDTNQLTVCSDCDFRLCISSGTGRGAFVVVGSTVPAADSTAAGVPMHCQ